MSLAYQPGDFRFGLLNTGLFGTPSLESYDEPPESMQSDLLPHRALSELEAEYVEASLGARDDGAAPASQLSRIYARRFIQALSLADQPSTVYFNHQGEAVLEWHPGPGVAAAVIIGGSGSLRFASSRFGTRTSGIHFLTGAVPGEVLEAIRRGAKC